MKRYSYYSLWEHVALAQDLQRLELMRRQYWYDPVILANLEKHKQFLLSQREERPCSIISHRPLLHNKRTNLQPNNILWLS